ncbi:MAG: sterol desaturase family protein [Oligoflexales bacterium]|nr:sterol desaturase family protein [Oligoflexales bacterium]
MNNNLIEKLGIFLDPFTWVFDPAKRIYWVCLFVSVLLAWVYLLSGKISKQHFLSLFDRKIWFHKSSFLDLKLLFFNSILKGLIVVPRFFSISVVSLVLYLAASSVLGAAIFPEASELSVLVFYSLFVFISEDFGRFVFHRFQHTIPFLWRFHQVHHSAEVLTPLTLYRTHPLEVGLNQVRDIIFISIPTALTMLLFGPNISGLDILGVDALGFVFNAFGANLRHSHVPISFGRLDRYFISPIMHQIHHSLDPQYFNKNFGTSLSCWDRWSKSLVIAANGNFESLEFGVPSADLNHRQNLRSAMMGPFFNPKANYSR